MLAGSRPAAGVNTAWVPSLPSSCQQTRGPEFLFTFLHRFLSRHISSHGVNPDLHGCKHVRRLADYQPQPLAAGAPTSCLPSGSSCGCGRFACERREHRKIPELFCKDGEVQVTLLLADPGDLQGSAMAVSPCCPLLSHKGTHVQAAGRWSFSLSFPRLPAWRQLSCRPLLLPASRCSSRTAASQHGAANNC